MGNMDYEFFFQKALTDLSPSLPSFMSHAQIMDALSYSKCNACFLFGSFFLKMFIRDT